MPCWNASSLWSGTRESAASSTRLYLFRPGISPLKTKQTKNYTIHTVPRNPAQKSASVRDLISVSLEKISQRLTSRRRRGASAGRIVESDSACMQKQGRRTNRGGGGGSKQNNDLFFLPFVPLVSVFLLVNVHQRGLSVKYTSVFKALTLNALRSEQFPIASSYWGRLAFGRNSFAYHAIVLEQSSVTWPRGQLFCVFYTKFSGKSEPLSCQVKMTH